MASPGACSSATFCFATVSGLNDMFPANGVQRCAKGFEILFLLFGGCVKNVSPISSDE